MPRVEENTTRAHRLYFLACGGVAAVLALACLLWPGLAAALLPAPLAPLHTRCIGALYGAAALALLLSAAESDIAAVRIPLGQTCAMAAGSAAATVAQANLAWPALNLVAATGAVLLMRADVTLRAPAENPDKPLLAAAAAALLAAGLLALWPSPAVPWWPWKMPSSAAHLYAAGFLGVGTAALMLARERRRDARRIGLVALGALAAAILAASLAHLSLFAAVSPASLLWFGSFAALGVLALRRLYRPAHRA